MIKSRLNEISFALSPQTFSMYVLQFWRARNAIAKKWFEVFFFLSFLRRTFILFLVCGNSPRRITSTTLTALNWTMWGYSVARRFDGRTVKDSIWLIKRRIDYTKCAGIYTINWSECSISYSSLMKSRNTVTFLDDRKCICEINSRSNWRRNYCFVWM